MTLENQPYWVVNLPREQWSETCPDFLLGADARDRKILGTRNEDYTIRSWAEVKDIASI